MAGGGRLAGVDVAQDSQVDVENTIFSGGLREWLRCGLGRHVNVNVGQIEDLIALEIRCPAAAQRCACMSI